MADIHAKSIQASIRAIPPTGATGSIPVYFCEDRDQRIGNASFDPATNTVDIEITDSEMSAFLQTNLRGGWSGQGNQMNYFTPEARPALERFIESEKKFQL